MENPCGRSRAGDSRDPKRTRTGVQEYCRGGANQEIAKPKEMIQIGNLVPLVRISGKYDSELRKVNMSSRVEHYPFLVRYPPIVRTEYIHCLNEWQMH